MNLLTETAFVDWLGSLTSLTGTAIHAGQDSQVVPEDATVIVASCDDSESPVASLYKATVSLTVTTPSNKPGALSDHKDVAEALRAEIEDPATLGSFFDPPADFRGLKVQSVAESREDDRWVTKVSVLVGLAVVPIPVEE